MITSSQTVTNLLKSSRSIKMGTACDIEYNINSMINFASDSIVTPSDYVTDQRKRFKKLFPLDSIIKTNRPQSAGIKYYINGDVASGSLPDPKAVEFPVDYRTYIPGTDTYYKYWISGLGSPVDITINYPKTIMANKIVIKFEISHSTPTQFSISRKKPAGSMTSIANQSSINIVDFNSLNFDAGTATIYYTGSGWSSNKNDLNKNAYESIDSLNLQVSAISNKYIGVVEICPRLVKDISDDVVGFEINKESSSSTEDIIPVGYVSSNSLSIDLNRYNQSQIKYETYSRNETVFEDDKVYLFKNAEITPYVKIYTSDSQYELISQGKFYVNDFSISEFGDVNITALDGAKILMETMCPDILCQDFSVVAILRTILDTVGFTNYKINIKSDLLKENGIISPSFWWTEDDKTVWQTIQELCRDAQITAFFDENNILQFYTRDYFYDDERSSLWTFTNTTITEGGSQVLPNIIDLTKNEYITANKIIINWSSASKANYLGDSTPIWKSDPTFLGALSVVKDIPYSLSDAPLYIPQEFSRDGLRRYIHLTPVVPTRYFDPESLYSFSGYLLVNNEIIEYDAIEYAYYPIGGGAIEFVDIQDGKDLLKYRGLAQTAEKSIWSTGRYRIKSRGAFDTPIGAHNTRRGSTLNGWQELVRTWK